MAQMNLSTKQKQARRRRGHTCGCQGDEGEEEERTGCLGLVRCKLLHLEWINNKVLRYSTGDYIQSPGINHNEKEYKARMYICV